MPVPDDVIFGPAKPDGKLTYGIVRSMKGNDRYEALKQRLDSFLVNQANELGKVDGGETKVYAPFPLFLITCVAIETLGKALRRPLQQMSDEEAQRDGFLAVASKFAPSFSRQLSKCDKAGYDALWGQDEHKKVKSIAHIIYRFGRHTMAHGFRGKGVYLTEGISSWSFESGSVILNPYWFWRRFVTVYEDEWKQLFEDNQPNNARKRSADEYLAELLG